MRIAFITNFCSHYRVKTFEMLAKHEDVSYYFFSAGKEWYWDQSHGVSRGDFHHEYLPAFGIGRTRVPYSLPYKLWHGNYDVYLKCINGKFALPVTYLIARLRGKPLVLWTGVWTRLETPLHRLTQPLLQHIFLHADAIVTYGTHVKDYLINEGVPAEKIFPSHHAVHNPDYNQTVPQAEIDRVRRELQINETQKIVLFVGRLVEVKGLRYLMQAFAQVGDPEAVLVLVGQGPEEEAVRRLAIQLGIIDRIRFAGYIPTNQLTPYYATAWVHVLPSITTHVERETWGLVVNEAFNQGIPSIVTDAVGAGVGGLVEDGVTGFIVPERDVNAFADRLDLILRDEELRHRLSVAAADKIKSWDNEAMVADFRSAIQYAVEQHRRDRKR